MELVDFWWSSVIIDRLSIDADLRLGNNAFADDADDESGVKSWCEVLNLLISTVEEVALAVTIFMLFEFLSSWDMMNYEIYWKRQYGKQEVQWDEHYNLFVYEKWILWTDWKWNEFNGKWQKDESMTRQNWVDDEMCH